MDMMWLLTGAPQVGRSEAGGCVLGRNQDWTRALLGLQEKDRLGA